MDVEAASLRNRRDKHPGEEVRQFVATLTRRRARRSNGSAPLEGFKIGLSFSVPDTTNQVETSLEPMHLNGAAADLVFNLLDRGATLAYGGLDAYERPKSNFGDFNQRVHFAARSFRSDTPPGDHLHPAWGPQRERRGQGRGHRPHPDVDAGGHAAGRARRCAQRSSSTAVRDAMAKDVDAQVFLCGRQVGYSGRMPGLLEEAILTRQANKPLFFLGASAG